MAGPNDSRRRRPAIRRTYAPEERRRALRALFAEDDDRWRFRFGFLLALSVAIAVMGLSLDSSAVVIGAMLIALLMTPVMATAAAVAMGWSRPLTVAAARLLPGPRGAYATVREEVSAALPGVAVAVALVPPLATVGLVLEAGQAELAEGALLLYLANLVAIILSGIAVFLATGFVPVRG